MNRIKKQKNKAFQYFPLSWGWQMIFFLGLLIFLMLMAAWVPLMNREAFQGLLAFEMYKTGNFLAPTLHGELQTVSPLYAWLLAGIYLLFGNSSLIVLRAMLVLYCLLFGVLVFFYHKRFLGIHTALLVALASLSTLPVVFSFGLWGSPAVLCSLLFVTHILLLEKLIKKDSQLPYLILLYTIVFLFYLLQGIVWATLGLVVLIAFLVYHKKTHLLMSLANLLALLYISAIIVGYAFFMEHIKPGYLTSVLSHQLAHTLPGYIVQSSWIDVFKNSLEFFKAFFLSMLPWIVFVPFLFIPHIRKQLINNKHLKFSAILIIILTLVLYLGFEYNGGSLIILGPFVFPMVFRAVKLALLNRSLILTRIYKVMLNILLFLLSVGSMVFLFMHGGTINNPYLKTSIFFILFSHTFYLGFKFPRHVLLSTVIAAFFFALFIRVLPVEKELNGQKPSVNNVKTVSRVVEKYKDKSLYLQVPVAKHPTDLNRFSFLFQMMSREIIYNKKMVLPGAYYITQPGDVDYALQTKMDEFSWAGETWYIVARRPGFNIQY